MKIRFLSIFLMLFCVRNLSLALTQEQQEKLIKVAHQISAHHIRYAQDWTPPDVGYDIVMDCSNTARYFYWEALRKNIPRTASDQYYELEQQGRITPAPRDGDGLVDTERLAKELHSGDLLFWEWTYNIKRRPPITHVMVFLGHTKDGKLKMFGSSSGGHGGVNIYDFDPNAPSGGVRSFFGSWVHRGRFVGFGRYKWPQETQVASNTK